MSGADEEAALVHGLAGDRVAPDWPPLSAAEGEWAAERWALIGCVGASGEARVVWRSPRPLSAAGLVTVDGSAASTPARTVFVKRHDRRVRSPESLACEHRFAGHLRAAGIEVPAVLLTPDGLSAVAREPSLGAVAAVYELHELAPGADLYRDADSWTGYRSFGHARAAGALLARLHLASRDFAAGPRPFGPLIDSDEITGAPDPLEALASLVRSRPGLRAGLTERLGREGLGELPWRREIERALGGWLTASAACIPGLPRGWTHGDWHPSNLTWSAEGEPVAVLDFGLANRTALVRDLAIAIERACVRWLEPTPVADLDAVRALLAGYEAVRVLAPAERAALPVLTATAHVEFALSEVEYYAGVLGSPGRAQVAYRDYLIGHARWFESAPGRALLEMLARSRG